MERMTEKILTVPETVRDEIKYYPVGNEWVALPELNEFGAVESFNVISEHHKGMIEFRGGAEKLLIPFLKVGSQPVELNGLLWTRLEDWVPSFTAEGTGWKLQGTVFCPNGFRGFVYLLEATNESEEPQSISLGWRGNWQLTEFTAFSARKSLGNNVSWYNRWTRTLTFEHRAGLPIVAWALGLSVPLAECQWEIDGRQGEGEKACSPGEPLQFSVEKGALVQPRESLQLALYVAVNREADGASTSVVDLQRHGWRSLLAKHTNWLKEHKPIKEDKGRAGYLCNLNGFYNYFFAQAKSYDTENTVLMTTRSRRYYVSAAFWARDAYLWSFPGVLHMDHATARKYLELGFTRYWRHRGNHALYIDGTDLYPGCELDEFCAVFIALDSYLKETNDWEFVDDTVLKACEDFLTELAEWKGENGLFKTFLSPTDDPAQDYPYLTYNNALVHKTLQVIAQLFERQGKHQWAQKLLTQSQELKDRIQKLCITTGPTGPMYAWAVDDQGAAQLLDQPPGSLQLLAYYGFCAADDPVFRNTVAWIHSQHNPDYITGRFSAPACEHSPFPWVMSHCYELINGNRQRALAQLLEANLDNDIACETIDAETGVVRTGAAFATCAGFLCHSLFLTLQK